MRLTDKIIVSPRHVYVYPDSSPGERTPFRAAWNMMFHGGAAELHGPLHVPQGVLPRVMEGVDVYLEHRLGLCLRWAVMEHHAAIVWGAVFGCSLASRLSTPPAYGRDTIFDRPVWRAPSDDAAITACVRDCYRYDRVLLGRSPVPRRPRYERTPRLERLRLAGKRRCGGGTATEIYAEAPRWDGFGSPPYARVTMPDNSRQEVAVEYNDHDQLDYILHGPGGTLRAAFGTAGSRLTLARV